MSRSLRWGIRIEHAAEGPVDPELIELLAALATARNGEDVSADDMVGQVLAESWLKAAAIASKSPLLSIELHRMAECLAAGLSIEIGLDRGLR